MFDGEVEVDESYFSGGRKGNRGRGALGKVPMFCLLKRNGKVYTPRFLTLRAILFCLLLGKR